MSSLIRPQIPQENAFVRVDIIGADSRVESQQSNAYGGLRGRKVSDRTRDIGKWCCGLSFFGGLFAIGIIFNKGCNDWNDQDAKCFPTLLVGLMGAVGSLCTCCGLIDRCKDDDDN